MGMGRISRRTDHSSYYYGRGEECVIFIHCKPFLHVGRDFFFPSFFFSSWKGSSSEDFLSFSPFFTPISSLIGQTFLIF